MATTVAGEGKPSLNGITTDSQTKTLTDLPTELLEHILCFPVLQHIDICSVSCCCKRLHDVCHGRGKVWGNQYKLRCYFTFHLRFGVCGVTTHCFMQRVCLYVDHLEPRFLLCVPGRVILLFANHLHVSL